MTDREREFAALGLEYAEGIDNAEVVVIPATGREARKNRRGRWEVQPGPPNADNYWLEFDDLLDAVRAALHQGVNDDGREGTTTAQDMGSEHS